MRYVSLIGMTGILALSSSLATAQTDDNVFNSSARTILDARALEFSEPAAARSIDGAADSVRVEFSAYDQKFSLVLKKNTRLVRDMQGAMGSNVQLYKGRLEGVDDSWVRLTRKNGTFNGAIYDGNELYLIDETGDAKSDMVPWLQSKISAEQPRSVIYKFSDTSDTATCGVEDDKSSAYQRLVNELKNSAANADVAMAADLQVNLAIVADTQYVASSSGDTNGQILSQMNVVDGIFSEQVGVQFGIERIIALSNNGTLTSTNPSTLLNRFRSYVNSQVGNPGLAHLFTGKNLNGNVIGIAYLRALCTSNGVGVTQAGGRGNRGALTAAHEFGHNFGAPHDNQGGSACASTAGRFLMNPSINGSDQFSQCSLRQIAPIVANAGCLVPGNGGPNPPPPAPDCVAGALDLRNVTAYSGNNTGSFSVADNGCSITLNGNIWRITETGYDITPETEVTFEFTASGSGEIQGIGFDGDRSASSNRVFKLAGTQNWGIGGFTYTGNGSPQTFTIPVGDFYTGVNFGLVIANDKDSGSANNSVTVSNVVLSNGTSTPPSACIELEDVVPFSSRNTGSFNASGCNMTLNGNIWRATNQNFEITPDTVLTFDFSSNGTGEIHGIGFDGDNRASSNRIFKLTGSQNWGIADYSYSGGNQSFEIPIGQYYTGSNMRLILVNDKDRGSGNNQSVFSNVKLVTP
ncbi:M12 family metallo-peptidase [Exilibacterium tricleocarpae]|nr:M12 family metallo-peptidase [Exilibacterium tricleocarpae]